MSIYKENKMADQFSRSELIFGTEALRKLKLSHVAVFGVGGVGSYAVEALARSGIGAIDLVDSDKFEITNLNRQLYAFHSTLGQYKVEVAAQRIADINPDCKVTAYKLRYLPETAELFDVAKYDYIIDAIDTISGKICLIEAAKRAKVAIISAMGAGNKVNPAAFEVADIYQTSVCPLAAIMRKELRKRGIDNVKVVYSKESPHKNGSEVVGSTSFTPAAAGLIMAGEVIKDLIKRTK